MKGFIKAGLLGLAAAAAQFAGSAVAPVAAQEEARIVVITHGQSNDAFWSVVKNGVMQAAKDYQVSVDYRAPDGFDMVAMSQLIDAAVAQKPAGLVVSIPDASALGPSIKNAVAAGIPVVSINSGSDVSRSLGALLHVGQDEYIAGQRAGEALKQAGGKKAICVNPEPGNVGVDRRCEGFKSGFGGEVATVPASMDQVETEARVRAALDADASIDTIMSLGALSSGDPVIAAVDKLNASGKYKIATFDLSPAFLKAVAEKKALFLLDQQQFLQGYLGVATLALYHRYGLMPAGQILSGPNLVTAEKARQVIDLASKGIR